jgi:hypothetical protein
VSALTALLAILPPPLRSRLNAKQEAKKSTQELPDELKYDVGLSLEFGLLLLETLDTWEKCMCFARRFDLGNSSSSRALTELTVLARRLV